MIFTASALAANLSFGAYAPACSEYQRPQFAEVAQVLCASSASETLFSELNELMLDCCRPGWDGYGAEAVSTEAYRAAERFIRSLPIGIPCPEIGADPDGCVSFEWRKSARRTVMVSVRTSNGLDYAALIGSAKFHGDEPFFGTVSETLQSLIRRVLAA